MLAEAIYKTVQYFDIQDHALTVLDISKFLLRIEGLEDRQFSLQEILMELEGVLQDRIEEYRGFFFLKGRKVLVAKRLENNFYATPRLKRAKRILPWLRHVPYVRAVSIGGSEALSNSKEGSDIDLLVITKPGRIWLTRIFVTTYFQILGMRRHGTHIANRFCLNHYLAGSQTLQEDQNLYTAVEYASQIPYLGNDLLQEFHRKNEWIRQYLAQPVFVSRQTMGFSITQRFFEFLLNNPVGNLLEHVAGILQRKKIKPQEHIIVSDTELSFHPGSKGRQVLSKFARV